MCLYKSHDEAIEALEDKECFKVCFLIWPKSSPTYVTVYQGYEIELGRIDNQPLKNEDMLNHVNSITEGAFHSFASLEDAKKVASRIGATVVRCILPKGTKHWLGLDGKGRPVFASLSIKYLKVIK